MKIKTYIINMKESVERRERVLKEVSRYSFLDIEWVEAVNGKQLMEVQIGQLFDRKRFYSRYDREPLPGEIGCTLSHRECYRRLLWSDCKYALILEDDVFFQHPDDVNWIFGNMDKVMISNKSCIITLASHQLYFTKDISKLGSYSFYRFIKAVGTCAYLVNRHAAEKLLAVNKPFIVADDFEYMFRHGIYLLGIYPYLAFGASSEQLVESEIIQDRKSSGIRKTSFKYRMTRFFDYKLYGLLWRLKIVKYRV